MNCQDILGDKTPQDLPRGNASFYWEVVHPYVQGAMAYLRVIEEGRQWIANLQANVGDAKSEEVRSYPIQYLILESFSSETLKFLSNSDQNFSSSFFQSEPNRSSKKEPRRANQFPGFSTPSFLAKSISLR